MIDFFDGMSSLEQVYWVAALVGSALFLIIFIMVFLGGDADSDMDADGTDFEADDGGVGFQFFTFKNIVAFFTIFGWTGLVCLSNDLSTTWSIFIATAAGIVMMIITSLLFLFMHRLAQSGTLNIKNALGVVGEVYIPIGAKRSKIGKIQLKVQGSLRELDAITDNDEDIPTSSIVKVSEIISGELLLVEKLSN